MKHFDDANLDVANTQLQDLIAMGELSPVERKHLISRVRKELGGKNISLDYLDCY